MDTFLEILKIASPVILVSGFCLYLVYLFLRHEDKKRKMEIGLANARVITPIRLQAYERLTLLLERISPESLIIREKREGMTNRQLQARLLQAVREEFEHNMSQQIYVSPQAWENISGARENMVKLINLKSVSLDPMGNSMQLSQELIEEVASSPAHPVKPAILFLKTELSVYFF